nr:reverse transcriptase domain-containing protein [Tanacetum cinerariifolium]
MKSPTFNSVLMNLLVKHGIDSKIFFEPVRIMCFNESFSEAWDRFKDLLRACPYHGFSELHQLNTFYNALNLKDQDSLNSTAGGNFLDKMPHECLAIIESKSKDMVKALLLDEKSQNQAPATMKAVKESCVTCGGAHSYRNFPA